MDIVELPREGRLRREPVVDGNNDNAKFSGKFDIARMVYLATPDHKTAAVHVIYAGGRLHFVRPIDPQGNGWIALSSASTELDDAHAGRIGRDAALRASKSCKRDSRRSSKFTGDGAAAALLSSRSIWC